MNRRFRFKFSKRSKYKYLSHLDIINIIVRALRRAKIRIEYSKGFNPKPKIAFGPPIPLGIESLAEYADVIILDNITEKDFLSKSNRQLAGRIIISDALEVPPGVKNLMSQVDIAEYSIKIRGNNLWGESAEECAERCLSDLKLGETVQNIETSEPERDKKYLLLLLHVYVRTLKDRNDRVFKLRDFLECFKNALSVHGMKIERVTKEELFILKGDRKLTPFEVL